MGLSSDPTGTHGAPVNILDGTLAAPSNSLHLTGLLLVQVRPLRTRNGAGSRLDGAPVETPDGIPVASSNLPHLAGLLPVQVTWL